MLFVNRVVLNPGLGGAGDVAFAIISRKQTHSNRVCYFQTLGAVCPKDPLSDYLEMPTAVVMTCGGSKKYPRTST